MSDATLERSGGSQWGILAALAFVGAGLAAGSRLTVAAAVICLAYAGAAAFGTRADASLRIHRRISVGPTEKHASNESTPGRRATIGSDDEVPSGDPGDVVAVRTTVENVGEKPLVDVRIADGLPDTLPVVGGSNRACLALEPGESETVSYELELDRGEHEFGDAAVRCRDLTGAVVETWTETVEGDGSVRCSPVVDRVPLGSSRNDYAGTVPADEGGSGVEFHSVRDYEPGDPVASIDWRRYANTRDLATVEYRAERATRVVCVVDARESQFRAPEDSELTAAELSADAAERTLEALLGAGHPTGVATLGDRNLTIVQPGTDAATRERATDLLESIRPGGYETSTFGWQRVNLVGELTRSLPGEAQVYVFSSFADDEPGDLVERLRVRGYTVRIVSPDVHRGDDAAVELAGLARENRLARARAAGARVVDWDLDRSLGPVLHEAIEEGRGR